MACRGRRDSRALQGPITPPVTRDFERRPSAPSGARSARTGLILVLIAAALLRVWGIDHGIPFSLGIDEPEIMERAVRMMKTSDFNPHFFECPLLRLQPADDRQSGSLQSVGGRPLERHAAVGCGRECNDADARLSG